MTNGGGGDWRTRSIVLCCNALQHILQHTATHCNTLQHTTIHCDTLRHTATHCDTLQHTTTLQHTATNCNMKGTHIDEWRGKRDWRTHSGALKRNGRMWRAFSAGVRCSVLQSVAVCCSVLQCVAVWCSVLQCVAVYYSVLQCVAVCAIRKMA